MVLNNAAVAVLVTGRAMERSPHMPRLGTSDMEIVRTVSAFSFTALFGLTATRRIRKNPACSNLPVIAMTARAMVGDREIRLEAGMNDHVSKPIMPESPHAVLKRRDRRKVT